MEFHKQGLAQQAMGTGPSTSSSAKVINLVLSCFCDSMFEWPKFLFPTVENHKQTQNLSFQK